MTNHVLQEWVTHLESRGLPLFAMNGIIDVPPRVCSCYKADSCDRPGKHPLHTDWQTERLDLANLPPWINLGIRTGQGLIVIDIDDPKLADPADFPTTFTVQTAAGFHLYYTHEITKLFRTMVAWRPGIDIRAEGGLVVSPPSLHVTGIRYMPTPETFDSPITPLPDELYSAIPAAIIRTASVPLPEDWEPTQTDAPNYGGMAEMLIEQMAEARQGERNGTLFRLASRLTEFIEAGMLRPDWLVRLSEAAQEAGLSHGEVWRTIGSASSGLVGSSSAPNTNRIHVLSSPKDGG